MQLALLLVTLNFRLRIPILLYAARDIFQPRIRRQFLQSDRLSSPPIRDFQSSSWYIHLIQLLSYVVKLDQSDQARCLRQECMNNLQGFVSLNVGPDCEKSALIRADSDCRSSRRCCLASSVKALVGNNCSRALVSRSLSCHHPWSVVKSWLLATLTERAG
jgi:hypothetical protein